MKVEKKQFAGCFVLVALAGLLNLGVILKDEDPIADAQTSPISLKQKLEEIKDGPKGAPSPSFTFYSKAGFLTESPMKTMPAEEGRQGEQTGTKEDEEKANPNAIPADIDRNDKMAGEDDWWSEDDTPGSKETKDQSEDPAPGVEK